VLAVPLGCECVCVCSPLLNLTNWDYNIAVCLGLDSVQLLLTVIAFTVLASTLYIIDRYFNSHYVIRRKVRHYCTFDVVPL